MKTYQPWTDDDRAYLIRTHLHVEATQQAQVLERTPDAVRGQICKMRRSGELTARRKPPWTRDSQRVLDMLNTGLSIKTIARRIGRAPDAVSKHLYSQRISPLEHMKRFEGLSVADVARELGINPWTVLKHIRTGRLVATHKVVIKQSVYSIAQAGVRTFIEQHGGYVPLDPDEDWAPLVEQARSSFRERYISRAMLSSVLFVWASVLRGWEHRRGLPTPVLCLEAAHGGAYYDRQAIRTWLDAHPEYNTTAARKELSR